MKPIPIHFVSTRMRRGVEILAFSLVFVLASTAYGSVQPTQLDFGGIVTGTTTEKSVVYTNDEVTPVDIDEPELTGPDTSAPFPPSPDSPFSILDYIVNGESLAKNDFPYTLNPDESLEIVVEFAPGEDGSYADNLEITVTSGTTNTIIVPISGQSLTTSTKIYYTQDAVIQAGGSVAIAMTMDMEENVAGIEFKIQPTINGEPTSDAQLAEIVSALNDSFTVAFSDSAGIITVVIYSLDGAEVAPGADVPILSMTFDIDEDAATGQTITLDVSGDVLVNSNREEMTHLVQEGSIYIETGKPGDINRDDRINIVDVVWAIHMIIDRIPAPTPGTFEFYLADINQDGALDVSDVVVMVNRILYDGTQPRVIAQAPTSPVVVALQVPQQQITGEWLIPISMQADGAVTAAQAAFAFDPSQLKVGTPAATGRASGMTIISHVNDGVMRMIVYSPDGQIIPSGDGATVLIPVSFVGGMDTAPEFILSEMILVNQHAQPIPVAIEADVAKVASIPSEFVLKANYPNPFNPSTSIAYEVPQQAHVVLAVYNLLGQEVLRLVDEPKTPGRYTVNWDGRNTVGLSVASGVYLYRITTSTGYTQSHRMTLLK